jgi:hypothetical protein
MSMTVTSSKKIAPSISGSVETQDVSLLQERHKASPRYIVAVPKQMRALMCQDMGTAFLSLPGRTTVRTMALAGLVLSGAIYYPFKIARYVCGGDGTERVVNRGLMYTDELATSVLVQEVAFRNAALSGVSTVGSVAGVGVVTEIAGTAVSIADDASKKSQKAATTIILRIASIAWGAIKMIANTAIMVKTQKALHECKMKSWRLLLDPSEVGENLLLSAEQHESDAWRLLAPAERGRKPVPPCSDEKFASFLQLSAPGKMLVLESVMASDRWILSSKETLSLTQTLERWEMNVQAKRTQSSKDSAVLRTLYSIFLYINNPEIKKAPASKEEIDEFLALPVEEQKKQLFLVIAVKRNRAQTRAFEEVWQRVQKGMKLTQSEYALLSQFIAFQKRLSESSVTHVLPVSTFRRLHPQFQGRIIDIVMKYATMDHLDRKRVQMYLSKSWAKLSKDDIDQLAWLALPYFSRLPHHVKCKMFDVSAEEVMMLTEEERIIFLAEVRTTLPCPTLLERLHVSIQGLPGNKFARTVKGQFEILEEFLSWKDPVKFVSDPKKITTLVKIINSRLSLEAKISARLALDNPLTVFSLSEEEITAKITQLQTLLETTKEPEKIESLKAELSLLQTAYTSQKSQSQFSFPIGGQERSDRLPPQKVEVPETPLALIDQAIGPHIVSGGPFYCGFNVLGKTTDVICTYGGWLAGLAPKGLGWTADTIGGRVLVYGGIRGFATTLQLLTMLQTVRAWLLMEVEEECQKRGFSWVHEVEERVAKLPMTGFKMGVSLQQTLLGGTQYVAGRFDNWTEEIRKLSDAHKRLSEKGSVGAVEETLRATQSEIASSVSQLAQAAGSEARSAQFSQETQATLQSISQLDPEEIKKLVSQSKDVNEVFIRLRQASLPEESRNSILSSSDDSQAAQESQQGWMQWMVNAPMGIFQSVSNGASSVYESVTHSSENKFLNEAKGSQSLDSTTQTLITRLSALETVYRDLKIATAAEQQLKNSHWFMELLAQSPVSRLSSEYQNTLKPAFDEALSAWKLEADCADKVLQLVGSVEAAQQKLAFGAVDLALKAGNSIEHGTDRAASGIEWFAKKVADELQEQRKTVSSDRGKKFVDQFLNLVTVGATAGVWGLHALGKIASTSLVGTTAAYAPIVLLPFLLNRAIPDALNAAAEPVSKNLGKALFGFGVGLEKTGVFVGAATRKELQAVGEYIQAAVNTGLGIIDEKRVSNFLILPEVEKKYVTEVILDSQYVPDGVKKGIRELGEQYFENRQEMNDANQKLFIQAILAAYNNLGPEDFLKISPAYFSNLPPRTQWRIQQIVKRYCPGICITGVPHLVSLFNTLTEEQRKKIHRITPQEYDQLSPEQQREICFHVIHSDAYKGRKGVELSPVELISLSDPAGSGPSRMRVLELLKTYPDLKDAELADISPQHLLKLGTARQIRLHEILQKYKAPLLSQLAKTLGIEESRFETILCAKNLIDPTLRIQKERLIAGMASLFRQMRLSQKRQFVKMSPAEVMAMTVDECKMYQDALLQRVPSMRKVLVNISVVLSSGEGINSSIAGVLSDVFNQLPDHEQISLRQHLAIHTYQVCSLVESFRKEIIEIDKKLLATDGLRKEIRLQMNGLEQLRNTLVRAEERTTVDEKSRIEAMTLEIKRLSTLLDIQEREIDTLFAARGQFTDLLRDEGADVTSPPIAITKGPSRIEIELSEKTIDILSSNLCKATTVQKLDALLEEGMVLLKGFISQVQQGSQKSEGFVKCLSKGFDRLQYVYESRKASIEKKTLSLPGYLQAMIESTKKDFEATEGEDDLKKIFDEKVELTKKMRRGFSEEPNISRDIEALTWEVTALYEKQLEEVKRRKLLIAKVAGAWRGIGKKILPAATDAPRLSANMKKLQSAVLTGKLKPSKRSE